MTCERLEQVKIVDIGKASILKSAPQNSGSWEGTYREKLTSHERNTTGLEVVRYNERGMSCLS